eukprot:jgi/Bigna1/66062/fgenesh1_pg.1_\
MQKLVAVACYFLLSGSLVARGMRVNGKLEHREARQELSRTIDSMFDPSLTKKYSLAVAKAFGLQASDVQLEDGDGATNLHADNQTDGAAGNAETPPYSKNGTLLSASPKPSSHHSHRDMEAANKKEDTGAKKNGGSKNDEASTNASKKDVEKPGDKKEKKSDKKVTPVKGDDPTEEDMGPKIEGPLSIPQATDHGNKALRKADRALEDIGESAAAIAKASGTEDRDFDDLRSTAQGLKEYVNGSTPLSKPPITAGDAASSSHHHHQQQEEKLNTTANSTLSTGSFPIPDATVAAAVVGGRAVPASGWGVWGPCSVECGQGHQIRSCVNPMYGCEGVYMRVCHRRAAEGPGGAPCTYEEPPTATTMLYPNKEEDKKNSSSSSSSSSSSPSSTSLEGKKEQQTTPKKEGEEVGVTKSEQIKTNNGTKIKTNNGTKTMSNTTEGGPKKAKVVYYDAHERYSPVHSTPLGGGRYVPAIDESAILGGGASYRLGHHRSSEMSYGDAAAPPARSGNELPLLTGEGEERRRMMGGGTNRIISPPGFSPPISSSSSSSMPLALPPLPSLGGYNYMGRGGEPAAAAAAGGGPPPFSRMNTTAGEEAPHYQQHHSTGEAAAASGGVQEAILSPQQLHHLSEGLPHPMEFPVGVGNSFQEHLTNGHQSEALMALSRLLNPPTAGTVGRNSSAMFSKFSKDSRSMSFKAVGKGRRAEDTKNRGKEQHLSSSSSSSPSSRSSKASPSSAHHHRRRLNKNSTSTGHMLEDAEDAGIDRIQTLMGEEFVSSGNTFEVSAPLMATRSNDIVPQAMVDGPPIVERDGVQLDQEDRYKNRLSALKIRGRSSTGADASYVHIKDQYEKAIFTDDLETANDIFNSDSMSTTTNPKAV